MSAEIESLAGVGPARAGELRALGLTTLRDLIEYFPRDYRMEHAEGSIRQLIPNEIQTVRGTVVACDYIASRPHPRFEATLDDGDAKLAMVWFHGAYLRRLISPGMTLRVRGKVTPFRQMPQMSNPKWEAIADERAPLTAPVFRAIYSATARLSSELIGSIISDNLDAGLQSIDEWFAPDFLQRHDLIDRREAYRRIHQPRDADEAARARRRLVFDELMLLQLALAMSRRQRNGRISAPVLRVDKLLDQRIRARFPFELTAAQQRAVHEVLRDLRSGVPMNRLLQGDVGSGKTIVAVYAMLVAIANKMQAAILAPTEVLAEQHYLTLKNILRGSSVRIDLLTGRVKGKARAATMAALRGNQTHLAIGTQALIQEDVEFANLGVVVIDEQHKLGVKQRALFKQMGTLPHYLVMTATPIPRTLALSWFADFDQSVLDELPPGRKPIKTRWLKAAQAGSAYEFIWQEVGRGRQAYIVLPQIDESGLDDAKSVKKEFARLSAGPLKGLRIGMLHGQLKSDEKDAAMQAFRTHHLDVLVTTTVIEVGIDVPNATIMLIDNADRFGLSQLHQLRGRVGRGSEQSHCLLISDTPGNDAQMRMQAMVKTSDGFEITEMDLQLRGPGDFFGTRQHGLPPLKLAQIDQEMDLLRLARDEALQLLADDPDLTHGTHAALRTALIQQFGSGLDLAQVG